MAGQENSKLIAVNRKARHDYFVMEAMEAGVELVGTEVKSIRTGAVNLKDSWVEIDGGELYVLGMHISPYEKGNIFNRDPVRKRKLLVHKREIKHLQEQQKLQGYTLIPLQLYFKRGWSLVCAKAKSSMTREPIWRRGKQNGTSTAP